MKLERLAFTLKENLFGSGTKRAGKVGMKIFYEKEKINSFSDDRCNFPLSFYVFAFRQCSQDRVLNRNVRDSAVFFLFLLGQC